MIKKLLQKHRQILLYLFFGVTTTLVNWCIYALLQMLRLEMTASNAIAWFGAVCYAFVTNKLFVFESKSWAGGLVLKEGVGFFASRITSGAVEILLPTVLYGVGLNQTLFGLDGGLAKALVSVLVIVLNYVLSKFLVFRKK